MQEREWTLAEGSLYYEIRGQEVHITRFQGRAGEVTVPSLIEGFPVTKLEKKAFLSRKNLRRVTLPDTLEELGDWTFAYCSSLEQVELPKRQIRFGRSVFLECEGLEQIIVRKALGDGQGRPVQEDDYFRLLAAAVTVFDAYYLLDIPEAGTAQWFARWDAKLVEVLKTPDEEGYSRQVLCGEEDYGSTDLAAYRSGSRKRKVRLAYLRLLAPRHLGAKLRGELEEYLLTHTKGRESEESWQVIRCEHGQERAYYQLFARLGCVDAGNLGEILADIGEEYPEMKAFFLTWRGEGQTEGVEKQDFFADFEL